VYIKSSEKKKESASDLLYEAKEHHQINNYLAAEIIN